MRDGAWAGCRDVLLQGGVCLGMCEGGAGLHTMFAAGSVLVVEGEVFV